MSLDLTTKHPQYGKYSPIWKQMRDTHEGERCVKEQGTTYLPSTLGMQENGQGVSSSSDGEKAYQNYKKRAVFHEFVAEALDTLVGVMNMKDAEIRLPSAMEYLRENATQNNESLQQLLQRTHAEQLLVGRIGYLVDMPENVPVENVAEAIYIATFHAESIQNWNAGLEEDKQILKVVVLNESQQVMDPATLQWEHKAMYSLLYFNGISYQKGTAIEEESIALSQLQTPTYQGRTIDEIPFTFINAKDILTDLDKIPLEPLSNMSLAIYRLEADYRQSLFMQGQDTLVISGEIAEDKELRTGAGAVIQLSDSNASAKYVGVESMGLSEQREALQNDKGEASGLQAKLMEKGEKESGEALTIRVSAKTATLTDIAKTAAFGLQKCLRQIAKWMGLNPMEVEVIPNLDFVKNTLNGQDILNLQLSKENGLPISRESIHKYLVKNEITTMSYEDEMAAINDEAPILTGIQEDEVDDGIGT